MAENKNNHKGCNIKIKTLESQLGSKEKRLRELQQLRNEQINRDRQRPRTPEQEMGDDMFLSFFNIFKLG